MVVGGTPVGQHAAADRPQGSVDALRRVENEMVVLNPVELPEDVRIDSGPSDAPAAEGDTPQRASHIFPRNGNYSPLILDSIEDAAFVPDTPPPRSPSLGKRKHSTNEEADDLDCLELRRAYKRLRTEHVTWEALMDNYVARLEVANTELMRTRQERETARVECAEARDRAETAEGERDDMRLELALRDRHEAVTLLAMGIMVMVVSGWVGITVGRELE